MQTKKRRTKLEWDENTHIINEVNQEPGLKQFLQNNRIYFETITATILSVMGIVISVVGIYVANVANEISLQQMEIEDSMRQPLFLLDTEYEQEQVVDYVKWTNGDIGYGEICAEGVLHVSLRDEYYYVKDDYYFVLDGFYENGYDEYLGEGNAFVLKRNLNYLDKIEEWEEVIRNHFDKLNLNCNVYLQNFYYIRYIDYRKNENTLWFKNDGELLEETVSLYGINQLYNLNLYNTDDKKLENILCEIEHDK